MGMWIDFMRPEVEESGSMRGQKGERRTIKDIIDTLFSNHSIRPFPEPGCFRLQTGQETLWEKRNLFVLRQMDDSE